jgi:hypothetical protein
MFSFSLKACLCGDTCVVLVENRKYGGRGDFILRRIERRQRKRAREIFVMTK